MGKLALFNGKIYVEKGVYAQALWAEDGVIVGVALFYAVLTVVSIILGDVLMSIMDPRISFTTTKER